MYDILFSLRNQNVNTFKDFTVNYYSGAGCGLVRVFDFFFFLYHNRLETYSSSVVRQSRPVNPVRGDLSCRICQILACVGCIVNT